MVGIARDSKELSLSEGPRPYFYRAFNQNYTGLATIVVQATGSPLAMAETVRRTLLRYRRASKFMRWTRWLTTSNSLAGKLDGLPLCS